MAETAHAILEKKQLLEEDLRRVEKQIYDLEGEYLQVHARGQNSIAIHLLSHCQHACAAQICALQETVKDGNILRGWDGYLGKQASSGAIRRINRFREADRMFSASSVTSGQASTFSSGQANKVRSNQCHLFFRA